MAISEFDVIDRFFHADTRLRDDVVLGIGDDAALLKVPKDRELAVAVDTLVGGRHFPNSASAFDVGYKVLAVNLSDLAAMGAIPAWATLSLTLPEVDESWLAGFAGGFFAMAAKYGVELVGGDTTRGPLSITVQVHGFVERGKALRRDRARPGQKIFVTGTLGDAACALKRHLAGQSVDPFLLERLNRPSPRVMFGRKLTEFGAAAIDISDGLLADLGHIVEASNCGATIDVHSLPRSDSVDACSGDLFDCQLSGGDDYELCFCIDPKHVAAVEQLAREMEIRLTEVGVVEQQAGIRCVLSDGSEYRPETGGYDHFAHD